MSILAPFEYEFFRNGFVAALVIGALCGFIGVYVVLRRMMAKLQQQYATKPDFQLVSFTVDPERDTPQALTSYATKFQADGKRWYFLTGQRDRILRLVEEGFHLAVATVSSDADPAGIIGHSPRFVLVDKDARIRGYYDSQESEAFVRLKNDIDSLVKG